MIADNKRPVRKAALLVIVPVLCLTLSAALTRAQQMDATAAWRPQIHFYAPPNWINDPNGPIFLNGQYNLSLIHI